VRSYNFFRRACFILDFRFVSLFAAEITSRMMMMKKEMRKMAG
jgi:hypothetical protein